MNKKKLALIMIVASMLLAVPLARAQTTLYWTDKPKYSPGDTVTVNISYYNGLAEAVQVNNITLTFDRWNAYIGGDWVGNKTYTYTSVTVTAKSVHVFDDLTFSVPTDGRAESTYVGVRMGTDHGFISNGEAVYVNVEQSNRFSDQLIMLLTILTVLTIVCTIIIAATIFLSARRPQVTWKAEEK